MAKILSLKSWTPAKYELGEGEDRVVITYEVKRLRQDEAVEFAATTLRAFSILDRARDEIGVIPPVPELPEDATEEQKTEHAALYEQRSRQFSAAVILMGQATKEFFDELGHAYVREIFERMVRNVAGVEVDDVAISSGLDFYDKVATDTIVTRVLSQIRGASGLTAAEGKDSGSPSISDSATTPSATVSGAPSTANEGGPVSSTATDTRATESCSEPAVPMAASPA